MKALAHDPSDRYQSVSELKRDLERFVGGLPIEAAPPGVFYQLKKLIQRHRLIAAVASLACLMVLAASAIAICFGFVANERLQDVLEMQSELKTERDRAVDAERKARLLAQTYLATAIFDQSITRYCVEHWDQLVAANPSLKSLPAPKEKEDLQSEIRGTIFDSNLLEPDQRVVVLGESKWLVKILSDISRKDMGHLLMPDQQTIPMGETAPIETVAPAPSEESKSAGPQPAVEDLQTAMDANFLMGYKPSYKFPVAAKKDYLSIFCEELRAIDQQLPVVADAEDSLGLCLIDMQQPDLAMAHFRESIRIRENYPELLAQTLQARLFIADCLEQMGDHKESGRAISQVRSEIAANSNSLDAHAIEYLSKAADAIQASEISPR